MREKEEVLVIGFGRLGQVIASQLADDFRVFIIEIEESKQKLAVKKGYKVTTEKNIPNFLTIYLCVPISKFEETINTLTDLVRKETLIIDTCSVKLYPVKVMNEKLKKCSILATHPLFGPDSVNGGLHGLPVVFCPVRVSDESLNKWTNFWDKKGAEIIIATPDEHDRKIAYTLGLTHFISRILGELDLEKFDITTNGYNALLQIVKNTNNDTWELFNDMQRYNPYTIEMRDKIYSAIRDVESKLDKTIAKNSVL